MKSSTASLYLTATTLLALPALAIPFNLTTRASSIYTLRDDYAATPATFFDRFSFWDSSTTVDPTTDGSSAYVPYDKALSTNLIAYIQPPTALGLPSITPDSSSIYLSTSSNPSTTSSPRDSVRLTSHASYGPGTLLVASISHLPATCGSWPALWMVRAGSGWPAGGEFDIIEGVHGSGGNIVSLHSTSGCSTSAPASAFSGSLTTANCDVKAPGQDDNAGCSVKGAEQDASFGAPFNAAGGGTFFALWEDDGFAVWFAGRGSAADVLARAGVQRSVDVATLGTPMARFAGGSCDWDSHFYDMSIVINTEICGAWAGQQNVWQDSGCAASTGFATCKDFALQRPDAFKEAYWVVDGLKVYGR